MSNSVNFPTEESIKITLFSFFYIGYNYIQKRIDKKLNLICIIRRPLTRLQCMLSYPTPPKGGVHSDEISNESSCTSLRDFNQNKSCF